MILEFRKIKRKDIEKIELAFELQAARDPLTAFHAERTAIYARQIARELTLYHLEEFVYYCSLIHDIGKLEVPASILYAPRKLTKSEFEIIKEHSRLGAEMAERLSLSSSIVSAVHDHHERIDGNGYPRRKKSIPIETQIISVADVYDALTEERPYRKRSFSHKEAINILKRQAFEESILKAIDKTAIKRSLQKRIKETNKKLRVFF